MINKIKFKIIEILNEEYYNKLLDEVARNIYFGTSDLKISGDFGERVESQLVERLFNLSLKDAQSGIFYKIENSIPEKDYKSFLLRLLLSKDTTLNVIEKIMSDDTIILHKTFNDFIYPTYASNETHEITNIYPNNELRDNTIKLLLTNPSNKFNDNYIKHTLSSIELFVQSEIRHYSNNQGILFMDKTEELKQAKVDLYEEIFSKLDRNPYVSKDSLLSYLKENKTNLYSSTIFALFDYCELNKAEQKEFIENHLSKGTLESFLMYNKLNVMDSSDKIILVNSDNKKTILNLNGYTMSKVEILIDSIRDINSNSNEDVKREMLLSLNETLGSNIELESISNVIEFKLERENFEQTLDIKDFK